MPEQTNPINIIREQNIEDKIFSSIINNNWRSTLIFLTKDMNIWNIDLKLLFERLSFYIKEIEEENLKVPSSIILLAAIIYNKKTKNLYLTQSALKKQQINEINEGNNPDEQVNEEWYEDEVEDELNQAEINNDFIPSIIMPPLRYIKRKISLDELINSFEDLFKVKHKKIRNFSFSLPIKNIKEKIQETFLLIKKNINGTQNDEIYFSNIAQGDDEKKLSTFISMLYLINQKKIYCTQNSIYDDIKIKMIA